MNPLEEELERYKAENGGSFNKSGSFCTQGTKNKKTDISALLENGEEILWQDEGKEPAAVSSKSNSSKKAIRMFAVVWTGFAVFWTVSVLSAGAGFMAFAGVPFIMIGIALFFMKTPRAYYTLTNHRIFCDYNGSLIATPLEAITFAQITHINKKEAVIHYAIDRSVNYAVPFELPSGDGGSINGIKDGDRVYSIFEKAVYDRKGQLQEIIENNQQV